MKFCFLQQFQRAGRGKLKKERLEISVSACYGESCEKMDPFDDRVPDDMKYGMRCSSVNVTVSQEGMKPENSVVIYSVKSNLDVRVFRMARGAEETITKYLKDLGYQKISF